MAKKSAKSKGYRKTIEKKPYLTKRDIIILCIILAIVAVGAILLFTYDDGALKVKDDKIVDAGENWLIVNGNARGRRYFKLGEIGEIEGYTMEAQPFVTDGNLTQFVFTPEAEDAGPDSITVSASAYDPARLVEGNSRMVSQVKDTKVSDIAADTLGDREYQWYTYTHEYYAEEEPSDGAEAAAEEAPAEEAAAEEAPAEEATAAEAPAEEAAEPEADAGSDAPNHFEQAMNAYISAPRNGSFVVSITAHADSADGYLTEDQLKAILAQAVEAITPVAEK